MKKNSLLLILLTLTSTAFATVDESYKELGLTSGQIKILSETSENCADGPFKIVGDGEEQVLMLGPRITLALPNKDKKFESHETASKCKEDTQSQFVKGELHVLTTVHSCPANLKRLESRVEEIVSIKEHKVTYQRLAKNEFRVQCIFEWSQNVAKK